MAITTRGFGSQGGVISTQGFGCVFVLAPTEEKDREDPGDFVHLFIDLRMKQLCKVTKTAMQTRQGATQVLLDDVDSDLTKADVHLRQAESDLRSLLIQRRVNP